MFIENFINRAIVVDNKKDEGEALAKMLEAYDIDVVNFHYGEEPMRTFSRNRQLIFIDFLLNEDLRQINENVSLVISALSELCGTDFGLYGLVVWTKHTDHLEELKKKITQAVYPEVTKEKSYAPIDDEEEEVSIPHINPPLFVIGLSKNKYIRAGYDYSELPQDLEKALKSDPASYFFVKWSMSVETGKEKAIQSIYNLVHNYQDQSKMLTYILRSLAMNQTGTQTAYDQLTADAYKAFDELLYADLLTQQKDEKIPLLADEIENPFGEKISDLHPISAALNKRICIDNDSISQDLVVPGNVYKLNEKKSPLMLNLNEECYKDGMKYIKDETITFIAIELTPPCDFSQGKKVRSRMIGGIAFPIPLDLDDKKKPTFSKLQIGDKGYPLIPICIDGDTPMCVIFDYRYLYTIETKELTDETRYKVWFRAKPRLFSDILQKFSSHAARLGLASINLYEYEEYRKKKIKK